MVYRMDKRGKNQWGENNPCWKGDKVKNGPLHRYLRLHNPPPDSCENCGKKETLDLANQTGIYKRDISHFKYLCRQCHVASDKRIKVMKEFAYQKGHHNETRWKNPKGCFLNEWGSYVASVRKDKKIYYLGSFKTEKEAVFAYQEKRKELYG